MGLDLLIRNGTIVDGSAAARYRGDVGIEGGRIVEIGRIRSVAERTIDADGLIVAPGFIDGHTHMDAQVAWDPIGSCSCWHGVTTVIMGNCGFALAPCKPDAREWFARCLTAVEDIPTEAMLAGIDWTWETYPEYLATVDRLPKAINYGAYIGHSALRMYVMGARALTEKATEDDLGRMAAAVQEAIRAGAMGFSSSRATTHVTPDGTPVASRIADWSELTFDNASAWELHDRGLVRTGYKADLVLFDEARVKPAMPTVETDLPGGARRLAQKAEGIAATVVNGEVTLEDGKATGRVPGRLLRGPGSRVA